jgi:biotin synthase-related radical SAM superfamily protein
MRKGGLPEKIRVSIGSAIVLGLTNGIMDAEPTTTYMLTYRPEKCSANCGFCPQARMSKGRADMLSRVTWPRFPTEQVVSKINRAGSFQNRILREKRVNKASLYSSVKLSNSL